MVSGLKGLGFSSADAKALVLEAMAHVSRGASEEELLREALRLSRPDVASKEAEPVLARPGGPEPGVDPVRKEATPTSGEVVPRPVGSQENGPDSHTVRDDSDRDVEAAAVSGLRSLGIGAEEARTWVEAAATHVSRPTSVAALLERALALRGRSKGVAHAATQPDAVVCGIEGGQRCPGGVEAGGASVVREGRSPSYRRAGGEAVSRFGGNRPAVSALRTRRRRGAIRGFCHGDGDGAESWPPFGQASGLGA